MCPTRSPIRPESAPKPAGVDIADRRQAEDALRVSEERLHEAQRIAKLGSWELDLRTDNLTWSPET